MQTVLVTGATGFVGSHVAELLRQTGYRVRLLVRDARRLVWFSHADYEVVAGTFESPESVTRAVDGVDFVIHCAGLTKALSESDYMRVNAEATALLARCSEQCGVDRFIFCSSLAACGPSTRFRSLTESDPPRPITPYGRSKLAGEFATQAELRATAWVIIRPPAVMGPRDEQFVPLFRMMNSWRLYTQVGADQRFYSLIGVRDLALMLAHSLSETAGLRETYFATMADSVEWSAVARSFANVSGKRCARLIVPAVVSQAIGALGDLRMRMTKQPVLLSSDKVNEFLAESWTCSGDKLARNWGIHCRDSLDDVVRMTLEFYLRQKWI